MTLKCFINKKYWFVQVGFLPGKSLTRRADNCHYLGCWSMLFNQWEILKSEEKKLSIVGSCPPSYINLTIQHLSCSVLCLRHKEKQVTDTKIYTGYTQWCKWTKREKKKKNGSDLHNPFSALVRSTSLASCQRRPGCVFSLCELY